MRVPTNIICTISDDRGEEPTYHGTNMSELITGGATVRCGRINKFWINNTFFRGTTCTSLVEHWWSHGAPGQPVD